MTCLLVVRSCSEYIERIGFNDGELFTLKNKMERRLNIEGDDGPTSSGRGTKKSLQRHDVNTRKDTVFVRCLMLFAWFVITSQRFLFFFFLLLFCCCCFSSLDIFLSLTMINWSEWRWSEVSVSCCQFNVFLCVWNFCSSSSELCPKNTHLIELKRNLN